MDNMTKEQIRARIKLLDEEIIANEDENRFMQEEIDALYKKLEAEPEIYAESYLEEHEKCWNETE